MYPLTVPDTASLNSRHIWEVGWACILTVKGTTPLPAAASSAQSSVTVLATTSDTSLKFPTSGPHLTAKGRLLKGRYLFAQTALPSTFVQRERFYDGAALKTVLQKVS